MTAEAVFQEIRDLLLQGKLELPALPEIALRVRDAAAKPTATVEGIYHIVMKDPSMAAHLVQVASSAGFGGGGVPNLKDVIRRLGFVRVSKLVTAHSIKPLFTTNHPALMQGMQVVWQSSNDVAATSSVIAQRFKHLDPDDAMLAGLVHKIGCLPVLALGNHIPQLTTDSYVLVMAMLQLQQEIGVRVMNAWNFPDVIKNAMLEYRDLQREHDGPVDYTDVVQAAWLERQMAAYPDQAESMKELPVYKRLGFVPEVDFIGIEWGTFAVL
jgi:HD-like signal output (HDOD) protein